MVHTHPFRLAVVPLTATSAPAISSTASGALYHYCYYLPGYYNPALQQTSPVQIDHCGYSWVESLACLEEAFANKQKMEDVMDPIRVCKETNE